ncbi:MAG: GldG family protein [Bdellovibrionales bacterium]|nr:GldG family protein [Bdellovibrionales bacterium]
MKKNLSVLGFFVTLCLGAVFLVVYPHLLWLAAGVWAASLLFAVLWIFLARERVWAFLTHKNTRYGANTALVVFLVLGILVFANVLGKEWSWRRDITRSGVNTLSPQTVKILQELDRGVTIQYFNVPQEKEKAEQVLRLYAHGSKKLKYEIVDPNRRPTLVKSLGIKKMDTAVLSVDGSERRQMVEGATEEKLTNGLIKLLKTRTQSVYFTTGHGERLWDDPAERPESYTALRGELEKQGFQPKPLNLFSEGKIPGDAAALMIAGPRSAFFPKEIEILKAWLDKGGKLLVALDLDIGESGLSKGSRQLAALLSGYGVQVDSKILVDPQSRAAGVEPQVLMGFVGARDHAVTKDFPVSSMGLVANFLIPLTTRLSKSVKEGVRVSSIVKSSPNAWAESDWGSIRKGLVNFSAESDFKGEMDLAYAVDKGEKDGFRAVVFASSSFGVNSVVNMAGNRDLFLNSVAWLANDESLISIRAKSDAKEESLDLQQKWLNVVFLLVVFVLPATILGTGIFVWFRRRGR